MVFHEFINIVIIQVSPLVQGQTPLETWGFDCPLPANLLKETAKPADPGNAAGDQEWMKKSEKQS